MAAMSDADRQSAARQWINHAFIKLAVTANMNWTDIKAAVDAVDDWCETNATAYNLALPVAFRNTATLAQKALLLAYVAMKRGGVI